MYTEPIIISYATKETPYEQIINDYLIPSLKKFNLLYEIKFIEDLGNWQKNTHVKAIIIKEFLLKLKKPVVFLDSDATIEKFPELLFKLKDYDVSYHELDWMLQWRDHKGDRKEILSGTLYFDYNDKVINFLNDWISFNNKSVQWEQKNMAQVLEKWKDKLKIYPLPYEYIVIPKQNNKLPNCIKQEDVIILHHQKSRQYKHRDNRHWGVRR